MGINFNFDKSTKSKLTFEDVEENAFFVCNRGSLCQKVNCNDYNVIADSEGNALADSYSDVLHETPIQRIIGTPFIIEF